MNSEDFICYERFDGWLEEGMKIYFASVEKPTKKTAQIKNEIEEMDTVQRTEVSCRMLSLFLERVANKIKND